MHLRDRMLNYIYVGAGNSNGKAKAGVGYLGDCCIPHHESTESSCRVGELGDPPARALSTDIHLIVAES